jgi:hypothetical protein
MPGSLTLIELVAVSSRPLPLILRDLGLELGAIGEDGGPGAGISSLSNVESPHVDAQNRCMSSSTVRDDAGDERPRSVLPTRTLRKLSES